MEILREIPGMWKNKGVPMLTIGELITILGDDYLAALLKDTPAKPGEVCDRLFKSLVNKLEGNA